jgi:uncharacterized membrane protein
MSDTEPAPATAPDEDAEKVSHLNCAACRVIDRADGVEDGHLGNPAHYGSTTSRDLFSLMRRVQDHTADSITAFSGSMRFVYIHLIWFGVWIALNVGLAGVGREFDKYPFGLLTMIVSLEAIFLATFVMISQNRQAARTDLRSQLDFENNIRGEIWSVHIGEAIGLDVEHVEEIVRRAIDGAQAAMRDTPTTPAKTQRSGDRDRPNPAGQVRG